MEFVVTWAMFKWAGALFAFLAVMGVLYGGIMPGSSGSRFWHVVGVAGFALLAIWACVIFYAGITS